MLVYSYLFLYILFLTKFICNFFYIFVFHLVTVKHEDILKDDASHFRLTRSVLKIVSFKFANLQYFDSTFMNLKIVRLV